jgi:hypothetical protein
MEVFSNYNKNQTHKKKEKIGLNNFYILSTVIYLLNFFISNYVPYVP